VADHPAKLSNGERRRLDIALFWARGDLLRAAWNAQSPYEVYDEALDGLDAEGVQAVAQALAARAADRCVVVISHVQTVFDGLPYTERRSV
jgi:DNA repair exonuclease SbcCD ATPase subunit